MRLAPVGYSGNSRCHRRRSGNGAVAAVMLSLPLSRGGWTTLTTQTRRQIAVLETGSVGRVEALKRERAAPDRPSRLGRPSRRDSCYLLYRISLPAGTRCAATAC